MSSTGLGHAWITFRIRLTIHVLQVRSARPLANKVRVTGFTIRSHFNWSLCFPGRATVLGQGEARIGGQRSGQAIA